MTKVDEQAKDGDLLGDFTNKPIFKVISSTGGEGSAEKFSNGIKPFTDHSGVTANIPKELENKWFGKAGIHGQSVEILAPGYIYILTMSKGFDVSPSLFAQGFKEEKIGGIVMLEDAIKVLGKQVKAGDKFSFGKYGVVVQK